LTILGNIANLGLGIKGGGENYYFSATIVGKNFRGDE
jgi:hypothetical protein